MKKLTTLYDNETAYNSDTKKILPEKFVDLVKRLLKFLLKLLYIFVMFSSFLGLWN